MGKLFVDAKARRDIASAIEAIKGQLQQVSERRDRCKVDDIVAKLAASSTIDPRLEAMYREVTQLVGIDGAMGELIPMLSLTGDDVSNKELKVVSVLGIGGLGKTTLAKVVYDKLKSQFDCGAFVPVGRNPDLKKVFRDILMDLDEHRYTDLNMLILDERQLINKLRDFLESNRYIIVIDDVWEAKSWETLRLAFIDNNKGSRIISTTRKSEVTSGNKVYKPKPLSDDNSKRLFYTRIFGGEDKCPDNEVDEVSNKILRKCGGIPLAIITMASLLVGKSWGQWFEVCNSIGFGDKDIEQVDKTMSILSLSYYDLPCHLRTCLLYLSSFPEDYIIDKNSLIWKWIAENFVHKKPGVWLFEVGEGYFNDLVNRSMIQAVASKDSSIIDGCRVHDMVLDLLRSLAREENFVTVLYNDEDMLSEISSTRRLAHQKSTMDAHLHNYKQGMQHLRSLTVYRCGADKELSFLLSFKLLRVLDLENVYTTSWHNARHIGNLIHLRYLGLKHTYMPELPEEIGALKFLQTLDLVENFFMEELPSSIGQLTQLVCLRASGLITSMPRGVIKTLTALEELAVQCQFNERFCRYQGQFKELGSLSELRVLKIKVISTMEQSILPDLMQSLGNLHKIQSLKLESHPGCGRADNAMFDAMALPGHLRHLLVSEYFVHLYRLPSCINPLCLVKLSHLELYVIDMDEHSMQILGELAELRHLVLSTRSTVRVNNVAADGFFHKLRSCKFYTSMVLFVLNEDSSVSFTLWNGTDDLVLSYGKKDGECPSAPAVMPNLEELLFSAQPKWSLMKCQGSHGNLGLEHLRSLQKVTAVISCELYMFEAEKMEAELGISCDRYFVEAWVMDAEDGLRDAIGVHPNHPTLVLGRKNEGVLASDVSDDTDADSATRRT
ncbi:hypothetical protein ZEAMMB73_Zm00001d007851 [Zea mays]|uniref:Uncharacterized protein n=1 Tax=Zea mays TaxID=4577 RepID=A0A1D6F9B3_MAIZE|nr:hypothetical protein ZEAMMB73_Zm00001d007851 [Zea mays]